MKKTGLIIIIITSIICGGLSSCRKLSPLPDNYETLFAAPRGFEEVIIDCESELKINEFFTDVSINNKNNFVITKIEGYYSNNRYIIEVIDENANASLELIFHKPSSEIAEYTTTYLACSDYSDSIHHAQVKLSSTESYLLSYDMIEEREIYVQYTKSYIIISLCELRFEAKTGLQDVITLSGRIRYEK